MASSLERSLYPQAGLTPTSGVQYFGSTGRGTAVDYFRPEAPTVQSSRPANNVNAGFSTPAASAYETPESGFVQTPTESGFGGGESVATGATTGGGVSPGTAAGLGTVASLGGLAAGLTGNLGLGMASGALGSVAAASQGNLGPAAAFGAGLMGASPLGAAALGLGVTGLSTGSVSNSQLGSTVGGLIGNAVAGPIGGIVGSALGSSASGGVAMDALGTIGQIGLGTVVNAFSTPNTQEQQEAIPVVDMGPTSQGTTVGQGTQGTTAAMQGGFGSGTTGTDTGTDSVGSPADSTAADNSGVGGWADGGLIGERPGITKRYADGGPLLAMGFAGGGRIAMGAVPSNASVNDRVNAILRNPQMRQSIVARAQQLMDSGELTPEEVTTMGRVAEAAMFNPSLYPQLRQFVAAQGMTPLPAAYDPSVVTKIIATARALAQSTPAGQVPPTSAAAVTPAAPGMNRGGMIRGPGTGRSDSIGTVNESTGEPVRVANGEYIIPEHVVRAKGQEFFDNLLRRYADVPKES